MLAKTIFAFIILWSSVIASADGPILYTGSVVNETGKEITATHGKANYKKESFENISGNFISEDLPKIKKVSSGFIPYKVKRLRIEKTAYGNVINIFNDDILIAQYENISFDYVGAKNKVGSEGIEDPRSLEPAHYEGKIDDNKCHLLIKYGKTSIKDKEETVLITSLSDCTKFSEYYGTYGKK